MFDILDMGASGLTAQRVRMDTIAGNIANINTLARRQRQTESLSPAVRGFRPRPGRRCIQTRRACAVGSLDQSPLPKRYDPGNPDADKEGYVSYPNVDLSIEFVNALEASRAYEANVTMMDTAKSMFNSSLRLLA